MIRCLMDALIDPDSQCSKCCIYCKKECNYRCELSKKCKTDEDVWHEDCVHAYE